MTSLQLTSDSTNENYGFFSRIRTKTRMSTVTAFLQHSTVSSSQSNYARNKRHSNSKGSSKTITICRKQKSIYKMMLYFYILIIEREIKTTIPFTVTSEIIKYPGANLIQKVKDWYPKNLKTLMKEI